MNQRAFVLLSCIAMLLPSAAAPLATARPAEDSTAQPDPFTIGSNAPANVTHAIAKLEGWGFTGTDAQRPTGRVTLQTTRDADELRGTLRLNKTASLAFVARKDGTAWIEATPMGVKIERFIGTTVPPSDGEAPRTILIDTIPSQGYASGYVEAPNADPAQRASFQVFDTPAAAIQQLPSLLRATLPKATVATIPPGGVPPFPVQTPGNLSLGDGSTPTTTVPEAWGPGDVNTPGVYVEVPSPPIPIPMQSSESAGATGGGTQSGEVNTGGGEGQSGGNSNAGNTPPDAPTVTGPPAVPKGEQGVFETSANDPDRGDQVDITFDWGDGTTDDVGSDAPGTVKTAQHKWNNPGVYTVVATAVDSHGAPSGPSTPFVVHVFDPSAGNLGGSGGAPPVLPPQQPAAPIASARVAASGQSVEFDAYTTDPAGNSIKYEFSWDDGTVSWSGWAASGHGVSMTHAWSGSGTMRVQVQARNGECANSGGSAATCVSKWSPITNITILSSVTDRAPASPTAPHGWDVAANGATTTFTTSAADPDNDNVQIEMDWQDGTPHTLTPLAPSGSQVSVTHTWNSSDAPGQHNVRARAIDTLGLAGDWSLPSAIRIGNQEQVFEYALLNFTVNDTTPYAMDPTNQSQILSIYTGDTINLTAVIENRGSQSNPIDVRFLDDGKTFSDLAYLIQPGEQKTITVVEPSAGLFASGIHEMSAEVAYSLQSEVEASKANNFAKKDIRVRPYAEGNGGYGALYDGAGPTNVEGIQLTSGLYSKQRTPDTDSFDDIQTGTTAAMRLLLWSPNFTGTQDKTWYFTDSVDVNVNGSGVTFANAVPTSANAGANLSQAFPLTTGYSQRAGSGAATVGLAYNVGNGTTTSGSGSSVSWHIVSNTTPSDQTHAIGVMFDATASGTAPTWDKISYGATYHYTRAERQGNNATILLYHDVLHTGTLPIQGSVEAGNWAGTDLIGTGDDYNVGDRSMTSTPVWDAQADQRRTYYDGTTDKNPRSQDQGDDPSQSSAYAWMRLDGPLYGPHEINWIFTGPDGSQHPAQHPYEYLGPAGAPGSYDSWLEVRDGLRFDTSLAARLRGTWTVTVYIDNRSTSTMTFHLLASTSDPETGPDAASDQDVRNRTGQVVDPVQQHDPSNEDLDVLHPLNWKYLNESRVDQEVQGQETKVDTITDNLISGYIQDQLSEALNITQSATSGLCTDANAASQCAAVYTLAHELVHEAAVTPGCTSRTARTMAAGQEQTASGLAKKETTQLGVDGSQVYTPADDLIGTPPAEGEGCIVRSALQQAWNTVESIIQPCAGIADSAVAKVNHNLPTVPSPGASRTSAATGTGGGGVGSGGSGSDGGGSNGTSLEDMIASQTPDLSCLQQTASAVLNATRIVNNVTSTALNTVNSTTSLVDSLVGSTTSLVNRTLNDTRGTILNETQNVTSLINGTVATLVGTLPLSPNTVNLNPKFIEDFDVEGAYETIMHNCPDQQTCQRSVSTVDSLFYNLYAQTGDGTQNWTMYNVGIGNVTGINVDNNTATGLSGTNGADLILSASLTAAQGTVPAIMLNASQAAPTLRVQALDDAAKNTPFVVCAYFQLPGVAYVAVECVDTRTATVQALGASGPSAGFPDTANVTLSAYSFDATNPNVTASLSLETSTSHANLPVVATGSIFQVDLTKKDKPAVPGGDRADASLFSVSGQGQNQWTFHRTLDPDAGATSEWSWTTNTATQLAASYNLGRAGRTLVAASNVTNPPAQLDFKSTRDAADTTSDITTQAAPASQVGSTVFAMTDANASSLGESFSLKATSLPASIALHADDAGNMTLSSQGGTPLGLQIVQSNNRASCDAPAGANVIARHGADATGGACVVLESSSSVQSVSVSLAAGGPSLNVASAQASSAPLSILLTPASGGSRSLDATLGGTPRSLSLQSSLSGKVPATGTPADGNAPPADGSTSITWTASDPIPSVRALAKSGSTILYWNATNVPTSLQAAYQWAADTITIRNPTAASGGTPGDLAFLLTNTGNAPATPSGDYVSGTKSGDNVQAAASLSAVDHVDANLAHESFSIAVGASPAGAFGLRYARAQGPGFTLDATHAPAGGFTLSTSETEGGAHATTYSAQGGLSPSDSISWAGTFPTESAHAEGVLAGPPTAVSITSNPSASSFAITAPSSVTLARVLHAPAAGSVSTLDGNDVLNLGNPSGGVDVYRASLRDVQRFSYANQTASLQVSGAPSHPLQVEVDAGSSILSFTSGTTTFPASLTASWGHAGVTTSASGITGSPSLDLRSITTTEHDHLSVANLPANLKTAWTSSPGLTTATLTHDAQGTLSIVAEAATMQPGQDAPVDSVNLTLTGAPQNVTVSMDATHGEMQFASTTTLNTPAPTAFASFLHANGLPGFSVPQQPQFATMTSPSADANSGAVGAQALQLSSASQMDVRLGHAPGQANRIQLVETANLPFYTSYADPTTGAKLAAILSNVPGSTTLDMTLGTDGANNTNAGGVNLTQTTTGGAITSLSATVTSAGSAPLALDLNLTSIPASWNAAWSPNQQALITSTAPLGIRALAVRPVGEDAPKIPTAAMDYATTDGRNAGTPRFGASFLAGITLLSVNAASGNATLAGLTPGRTVDLLDQQGSTSQPVLLSLHAASTPASFRLTTPPANTPTILSWTATGSTSAVNYSLDGTSARWRFDAASVPSSVQIVLDAPNDVLTATAPGGVGALRAEYVNSPTGAFHSDGPGVTFLDHATGPEGYDASTEGLAIDVPNLVTLSVSLPVANATSQSMVLQLARTTAAPVTSGAFVFAGGANAYRVNATSIGSMLSLVSQPSGAAGGMHDALQTDTSLATFLVQSRAKEGTSLLTAASVPTLLDLNASVDAQQALHLAYAANGRASSVAWVVNASNVLTSAISTNAPRAFRIEAPTVCSSQTSTSGLAWSPSMDTADTLSFLVANANSVRLPNATQPSFLVAACAGNDASSNVQGSGFQQAYWTMDPTTSSLTASLNAAPSMPQDTRLILTGADQNIVLDVTAAQLASGVNVTGLSASKETKATWQASGSAASALLFLKTGTGGLNATLANPALSLVLDAIPDVLNVLHFAGSGPTGGLQAALNMPNMTVGLAATGLPTNLDWNFPLHASPRPSQGMMANVTTDGTGKVASLSSWIIPTSSSAVSNSTAPEHAILESNGGDMQLDLSLTGMQSVTWTQTPPPSPMSMSAEIPAPPSLVQNAATTIQHAAAALAQSALNFMGLGLPVTPSSTAGPLPVAPPQASPHASPSAATPSASPASTTLDLQRDASTPSPSAAQVMLDTGQQGAAMSTILTQPPAASSVTVHRAADGSAEHDITTSTSGTGVTTIFNDALGSLREELVAPPTTSSTSFLPNGSLDHNAPASLPELHAAFKPANGPLVQADLTNSVPPRVTIMPGSSSCDGSTAPYSFTADTHNTGTIGRADYRLTDDGKQTPIIPGPVGFAIDCQGGSAREIHGLLPNLATASIRWQMSSSPCFVEGSFPTSTTGLTIPVVTPFFTANLTSQTASTTAGRLDFYLHHLTGPNTDIDFHAVDPTTGSTIQMAKLGLDYLKGPLSEDAVCGLVFGNSPVQKMSALLTGANGVAHATIGIDGDGRSLFQVSGGSVNLAQADILLAKSSSTSPPSSSNGCNGGTSTPNQPGAPNEPIRVNISAIVPVTTMNVKFHQTPQPARVAGVAPGFPSSPNYFYGSIRNGLLAGEANIQGFQAASVVADFDPTRSTVDATANYNGANGPVDVLVDTDQASGGGNFAIKNVRLTSSALPSGATFSYSPENGLVLTGTTSAAVSEIKAVGDVTVFCNPVKAILLVQDIPAGDLDLEFKLGSAGRIIATSTGGPIGDVEIGALMGSKSNDMISVALTGATGLHLEWDLDGDRTHTADDPYYIFASSEGFQVPAVALRFRVGDWGFGVGIQGVAFGGTQLRWYMKDFLNVPIPSVSLAGRLCAAGDLIAQVGYQRTWFSFPIATDPPVGLCV